MTIFQETDNQIFQKRQKGYTPNEIHYWKQSINPLEDEIISLIHVARVCNEKGMPFSEKQIKRVFNKNYNYKFHGDKKSYWNFIKKFCSKKLIVFKYERSKVSKKVPSDPCKKKKLSILRAENKKVRVSTAGGENGRE